MNRDRGQNYCDFCGCIGNDLHVLHSPATQEPLHLVCTQCFENVERARRDPEFLDRITKGLKLAIKSLKAELERRETARK